MMPMALEPPPTQAQIASGMVDAVPVLQLLLGLLADDLLEVAHHGRERMRSRDRAEQVVRVFDVGDPVAQRLVDGVLEDRDRPGSTSTTSAPSMRMRATFSA